MSLHPAKIMETIGHGDTTPAISSGKICLPRNIHHKKNGKATPIHYKKVVPLGQFKLHL